MSSQNNPSSPPWTYRMEVSPTGQPTGAVLPNVTDPIALLQFLVNLQSQTLEMQRQILEMQRQHLELARETTHVSREMRSRQVADLERWQQSHGSVLNACKTTLSRLEQVHASLLNELAGYVEENYENLMDGDFVLSDFVDKYGPRLAHLNTMLAVLRPLAAAQPNSGNANAPKPEG